MEAWSGKHMGFDHIASAQADVINALYEEHFNPYLNSIWTLIGRARFRNWKKTAGARRLTPTGGMPRRGKGWRRQRYRGDDEDAKSKTKTVRRLRAKADCVKARAAKCRLENAIPPQKPENGHNRPAAGLQENPEETKTWFRTTACPWTSKYL
jgi:hypothetical protein